MALDQPSVRCRSPINPASEFPFRHVTRSGVKLDAACFEARSIDEEIIVISTLKMRELAALRCFEVFGDELRRDDQWFRPEARCRDGLSRHMTMCSHGPEIPRLRFIRAFRFFIWTPQTYMGMRPQRSISKMDRRDGFRNFRGRTNLLNRKRSRVR